MEWEADQAVQEESRSGGDPGKRFRRSVAKVAPQSFQQGQRQPEYDKEAGQAELGGPFERVAVQVVASHPRRLLGKRRSIERENPLGLSAADAPSN